MKTISYVPSLAAPADTTIAFVRWAIAQLQLDATQPTPGVYRIDFPAVAESTEPESPLVFTFDPELADQAAHPPVGLVDLAGDIVQRLVEKLRGEGIAAHARPRRQPEQVHELTGRLFSAYDVEGGSVHLAGCRLQERPFLRLTACCAGQHETPELVHQWVDAAGDLVDPELAQSLGLEDIVRREGLPPRFDQQMVERMKDAALQRIGTASGQDATGNNGNRSDLGILATTIVWCKYAVGKLRFEIGEAEAEQPFEGWAMTLVAPPYHCAVTGAESFELAATDDRRITARSEIEVCEATGTRALRSELVLCAASGKLVLASHASLCPVSGDAVLSKSLATCEVCQQQVSPTAIRGTTCQACRGMRSVSQDDARLARILGQHPGFDRFRSWKLAETRDVYIVCGSTFLQQTLMVLDKQTIAALHLAHKNRFSRSWTPLAEFEREELFGADE